jgi:hypothetical protein
MSKVKERLNKELKQKNTQFSVTEMIAQRRWTEGGLQELRTLHSWGWPYFDALVALSQAGCLLDESQLAFGLRYTVSSLYAYDENARAMAIEKATLAGKQVVYDDFILF